MVYSVEGRINLVFLLQPAWLPPLPSVDVTANLPGYIILLTNKLKGTVPGNPWCTLSANKLKGTVPGYSYLRIIRLTR